MAKGFNYIACFGIGLFDLVAIFLSIMAEMGQTKAEQSSSIPECQERSEYARTVGTFAIVFLIVAHTIAVLVAIFGAFTANDDGPADEGRCTKASFVSFIITWVIFIVSIVSLVLLVLGKDKNSSSCSFKNSKFGIVGGIGCMLHAVAGIATYYNSAAERS